MSNAIIAAWRAGKIAVAENRVRQLQRSIEQEEWGLSLLKTDLRVAEAKLQELRDADKV